MAFCLFFVSFANRRRFSPLMILIRTPQVQAHWVRGMEMTPPSLPWASLPPSFLPSSFPSLLLSFRPPALLSTAAAWIPAMPGTLLGIRGSKMKDVVPSVVYYPVIQYLLTIFPSLQGETGSERWVFRGGEKCRHCPCLPSIWRVARG